MIRRTTCRSPADWLLIAQVEHADLARQLAAAWDEDRSPFATDRAALLPILQRHDDGWEAWDASVDLEPVSRLPLDFMERSRDEADTISRCSIEGVADLGPLAQWLVADHFVTLRMRRGTAERSGFVREYRPRVAQWRQAWLSRAGSRAAAPGRISGQLPFFDALSLWLCGADLPATTRLSDWNGQSYRLECEPGGEPKIWPWPFADDACQLGVQAFAVVQSSLTAAGQPLRHVGRPHRLRWTLRRPPPA